jgi:hypothetical protein
MVSVRSSCLFLACCFWLFSSRSLWISNSLTQLCSRDRWRKQRVRRRGRGACSSNPHQNGNGSLDERLPLPFSIERLFLLRLTRAGPKGTGGAGGIRTHEWRFCRPLPWATWVPRRTFKYSENTHECQDIAWRTRNALITYFLETAPGAAMFASRRNRADSSGGVGLM